MRETVNIKWLKIKEFNNEMLDMEAAEDEMDVGDRGDTTHRLIHHS